MSGGRFHVHYFWDAVLPNRYAAGIQILRTGAAFAQRGHRFTCHPRALLGGEGDVLAHYGAAAEGMALAPFAFPARAGVVGDWLLRRRLARLIGALGAGERHVLIVRGGTAIRMAGALVPATMRGRAARPLVLLEMHNLHFLRMAEKRLGRAVDPASLDDAHGRATRAREGRLVGAVDGLLCLTQPVRQAVASLVARLPPSVLLPSGTDVGVRASRAVQRYDVVYAGKLEARKGVGDLVGAMAHLPGRTLALAGGPAEAARDLARVAAGLGVADRVTFAGLLPPSEVAGFLLSGRVGACPLPAGRDSVSDAFTSPMKLLEMMALGLPVVATDVPPVRALVTDGVDGVLARPNDPAAMAGAIARLLEAPAEAARLGCAARARAAAFSWERRAETLEGFLRSLDPS